MNESQRCLINRVTNSGKFSPLALIKTSRLIVSDNKVWYRVSDFFKRPSYYYPLVKSVHNNYTHVKVHDQVFKDEVLLFLHFQPICMKIEPSSVNYPFSMPPFTPRPKQIWHGTRISPVFKPSYFRFRVGLAGSRMLWIRNSQEACLICIPKSFEKIWNLVDIKPLLIR